MLFRQLLTLASCLWLSMCALVAMQQPAMLPPFFHDSIMTKFYKKMHKKSESVDLKQYDPIELVARARELKDSKPELAESLLCAFTEIVNWQHGYEQLGLFYESFERYHEAAKAFCSAQSAFAFHRLGDIFAHNLRDENRSAQAYIMATLAGNASFASYAKLFEDKLLSVVSGSVAQRLITNAIHGHSLALHQSQLPSCCHLVELLYKQVNDRHTKIDANLYKFALVNHQALSSRLHGNAASFKHTIDDASLARDLKKFEHNKAILPHYESLLQAVSADTVEHRCYDDAMVQGAQRGDPAAFFALASDIYQNAIPKDSSEIARCYLMALNESDSVLRKTIVEKLREQACGKKYDVVPELFLMALEHQCNDIASDVMQAMHNRNYLVAPQCATYLVEQQCQRFGAFVYEKANPIAIELFMRMLEMASLCCYHLPLEQWCKIYKHEDQPAYQGNGRHFAQCSLEWYHLQRLRMTTYHEAHGKKIDVNKRFIEFAQTIGACCCEKEDYNTAVPFLFPAAQLGDLVAREMLTALCLANPSYIAPEQGWMLPVAEKFIKDKGEHARVIKLYLLMGQGAAEREQAFQLFCTLFDDPQEAQYAASSISNPLDDRIVQLANRGDAAAMKMVALQSFLLRENIDKAYAMIQSIADRADAWTMYLYTLLAEQVADLPDRETSVVLSYHNLCYAGEPFIRYKAEEALHRYAAQGCQTAKQSLAMLASDSANLGGFIQLSRGLSIDHVRQHFFDWYVDGMLNQWPHQNHDAPSLAAQRFYLEALHVATDHGWCPQQETIKTARTFGRFHYDAMNHEKACMFLMPAAKQGDQKSQTMLATIIAQNPRLVTPDMTAYMLPAIDGAVREKISNADFAQLYLLLCGTTGERAAAFKALSDRLSDGRCKELITKMPTAVHDHVARLASDGDQYALLTMALIAIAVEKFDEIPAMVMTMPHSDNPWIIFIQSVKAECDAKRDRAIIRHRDGYNQLLHCGISYIEKQATAGLMRAIKNSDPVAQALLFCDCCEHNDRRSAIAVFAASKVEKLFYDYLNTNCFDRLVKASDRNAFAAFVLGNLYEQRAAVSKDSVSQFVENLCLAFESYRSANLAGHSCSLKIIQLAFYLAVEYRNMKQDREAERAEAIADSFDALEVQKGLKALLDSKLLRQEHVEYIIGRLERFISKYDALAIELADWFAHGKQFTNGCALLPDAQKALYCAECAARSSEEGKRCHAMLVLKQAKPSGTSIRKALAYLQTQKSLDPAAKALMVQALEQENKKRFAKEQQQREQDLDVLRTAQTEDTASSAASKRLEEAAGRGDDQAARAVGLYLMNMASDVKNIHERAQKAFPYLEAYHDKHPEDTEVGKALIRALFYRSSHRSDDYQRAYKLLNQYVGGRLPIVLAADIEPFGIIAFKNNDYKRALMWFARCDSLSNVAAWYAAVACFHDPEMFEKHRYHVIKYLMTALSLSEKEIAIKAGQLDEAVFVVEQLRKWDDPSALGWLARLSLVIKNQKTLHDVIGHQLFFGQRLLLAAKDDPCTVNLLLFAFRNKEWGVDKSYIKNLIGNSDSLIKKWTQIVVDRDPMVNNADLIHIAHDELLRECSFIARMLYGDSRSKLRGEQLPLLTWACCTTACCKILDDQPEVRRDGFDLLLDLEEFLAICPQLEILLPVFQKSFCHDLLGKRARLTDVNNPHALLALMLTFSLNLLPEVVAKRMADLVDQFIHTILEVPHELITDIEQKDFSIIARVAAHFGNYLREQKQPQEEYKRCFEKALSFNPFDRQALWGLGWTNVKNGNPDEVRQGILLLEQLVEKIPSGATAFSLAMLYLKGKSDGSLKIPADHEKSLKYFRHAAQMGHENAVRIVESVAKHEKYREEAGSKRSKAMDEVAVAKKLKQGIELLHTQHIEEALKQFELLMNGYKNVCAASLAASLYIEANRDLERGAFCLLQYLECLKDSRNVEKFFVDRFIELLITFHEIGNKNVIVQYWYWVIKEKCLSLKMYFKEIY